MEFLYLLFLFILLFIVIIACFFSISLVIGLFMAKGVPFISSPSCDLKNICKSADLKKGEIIYDLGCGKANLLTVASKEFGAKGIGYEISLWPFVWAYLRIKFLKADVKIYLKNFLKADLSQADVVFCYLFPEIMEKLESKFQSELKSGARVVSHSFKLPNITPSNVIDGKQSKKIFNKNLRATGKIYVYRF